MFGDRGLRRTGAVVLATAICIATAASGAVAKRILPKGTPYAAETKASILGTVDIHYTDDDTTYKACDASFPSTVAEVKVDKRFSLDWVATYPQVTVPVADTRELGKAYKRLHVPPEPTSDGRGGLITGDYNISGTGPQTTAGDEFTETDCTHTPFGGSGRFSSVGHPSFALMDRPGDFFGPKSVFFFTMPTLKAEPPTYVDSYGNTQNVIEDYQNAGNAVPIRAALLLVDPTYASVPADFSIDELKKLIHSSTVTLHPSTFSGTHNCSTPGTPGVVSDVCSVTWDFKWHVKLQKRFLYRTKRAYSR